MYKPYRLIVPVDFDKCLVMAARDVETERAEGVNYGDDSDEMHEWLKQNRLLKFEDNIKELEIAIDDLLNYTEEQIEFSACINTSNCIRNILINHE